MKHLFSKFVCSLPAVFLAMSVATPVFADHNTAAAPSDLSGYVPSSNLYFQGQYLEFYRGPQSQVIVSYPSGYWVDLGGEVINEPVAFIDSRGEARILAYGANGVYYSRTLSTGWEKWDGILIETPNVVLMNGETYLVGRGLNRAVYFRMLLEGWRKLGGEIISLF